MTTRRARLIAPSASGTHLAPTDWKRCAAFSHPLPGLRDPFLSRVT